MPPPRANDDHLRVIQYIEHTEARRRSLLWRKRSQSDLFEMSCMVMSSTIGVFLLGIVVAALAGNPSTRWTSPVSAILKKAPNDIWGWYSLVDGPQDLVLSNAKVHHFHLPSRECMIIWLIGVALVIPPFLRRGPTLSVLFSISTLMAGGALTLLTILFLWLEWIPSWN